MVISQLVAQLVAPAIAQIGDAIDVWARGRVRGRAIPRSYTVSVTLPGTSGQVVEARAAALRNSRYPFVVEEIHLYENAASKTDWRFEVQDRDTGETLFGSPQRIPYLGTSFVLGVVRGGGPLRFRGYVQSPDKGGLRVLLESAGTANTVEITVRGFWVVPEGDPLCDLTGSGVA